MKRTGTFSFLVILFLLVIVVRSINILGFPLYLDEGIYISWIKLMTQSLDFAYQSLSDGKTPLYIWSVAGVSSWFSSTWLAARMVSVVAGAVTAVAWAGSTQLLFGKKQMWMYGVFALITPYLFFVEKMAFVDSMVTALISISFLVWLLARKQLDGQFSQKSIVMALVCSLVAGIVLAIAYMTKTSARIFVVAQVILGLVWVLEFILKKQWHKAGLSVVLTGLMAAANYEVIGYMRVGAARYWMSIVSKETELAYPPAEIWVRLKENPLLYLDSLQKASDFFVFYLVGVLLLFFVSFYFLYSNRNNIQKLQKSYLHAAWLFVYIGLVFCGSVLAGRVIASRYFYPIVPAVLSFATLGAVWLYQQKNIWLKRTLYAAIAVTVLASMVMIIVPLQFPYAGKESAFTRKDLSAVGLRDIEQIVDPETSIVAITGIWGVKDGSAIYLREQGMEALGITDAIEITDYLMPDDPAPICPEGSVAIGSACWKLNDQPLLVSSRPNKYYFLTDEASRPETIILHPGVEVVKAFPHPGGFTTYLLKLKQE